MKLAEFSYHYQHYVFEKTEKGGRRKPLSLRSRPSSALIWQQGEKTDERIQNNTSLFHAFVIRGVPNEDFRQNQRDGKGWMGIQGHQNNRRLQPHANILKK